MDQANRTRIELEKALTKAVELHPATAEHRALSLSYDTRFAQGIDAAARGETLTLLGIIEDELRDERQRVASYRQRVAAWKAAAEAVPTDLDETDYIEAIAAIGPGLGMHLEWAEQRLAGRQQEFNEVLRLFSDEVSKRLLARGGGRLTADDLTGKEVA